MQVKIIDAQPIISNASEYYVEQLEISKENSYFDLEQKSLD